jgi:hypothetical protein
MARRLNLLSQMLTGISIVSLSLAVVLLVTGPARGYSCLTDTTTCTSANGQTCDPWISGQHCDTDSVCHCTNSQKAGCACMVTGGGCDPDCSL